MTFTDTRGNEYSLAITIGAAIDVHNQVGVNILDVSSTEYPETDPSPLPISTRLFVDDMFLARVVFAMLDGATNLSFIDFCDGLDGKSMKRMSDAFFEAYEYFFEERGATAAVKSLRMQREQWKKITAEELTRLDSIASTDSQGAPESDLTISEE